MTKARLLASIIGTSAAAIVLAGCASTTAGSPSAADAPSPGAGFGSTTATPSTTPSALPHSTGTGSATDSSCQLPLTHETDEGFHIAVPTGWDLSTLNGQVVVASTPSDTEAVLVYPALLTNGLTAQSFFTKYLDAIDGQNAKAGAPVTTTPISGANGLPAVSFTQTVNGTQLQGVATVVVKPLATATSSQEAAFVSMWAPAGQFSGDAAQLAAIAGCYGPEPAVPSRIFQDQAFTYAMPLGWSTFDENSNGIDLHGPGNSDVSYILAGPVQTSEFSSPQTMISWFLNGVGITDVSSLTEVASPPRQASNGGTEAEDYRQFSGTSHGTSVRGLVFAYTDTGGGVSEGFIRMALSGTDQWNALTGLMIQIAGSIQHDFTQDLQTLQRVNQQWQDFSGQVADFDDVLNQQQLVRDPSTGVLYETPYSNWNPNGPQGPGYYLPNGDPLNPVSR
jgi:hypothetical protein